MTDTVDRHKTEETALNRWTEDDFHLDDSGNK